VKYFALTRLQDPLSLAALSAKALHRGVCAQRPVRVVGRHPQRPQAASGISFGMQANDRCHTPLLRKALA